MARSRGAPANTSQTRNAIVTRTRIKICMRVLFRLWSKPADDAGGAAASISNWRTATSLCLLDLCDGRLPIHLFRIEIDLIAGFHRAQEFGIGYRVDHGHTFIHVELRRWSVLDRN